MDAPIVITSSDLVDHTVLVRKRTETMFHRDFLVRNGAKSEDVHVSALIKLLSEIDSKLKPIDEKLKAVDIITIVPRRAEITELTHRINQSPRDEIDRSMKSKSGELYELLVQRAAITRNNYERREEIARLTIMLNMLPRKEAEALRAIVEAKSGLEVSVSSLNDEQKQETATLLGRLGIIAFITGGTLCLDKKKVDGLTYVSWGGETERQLSTQGQVSKAWIDNSRLAEWEENEKHISEISRKIQVLLAQSQASKLSDEQQKEFESLQNLYLELRHRRMSMANIKAPIFVSLQRSQRPQAHGEVDSIDLGPAA